MKQDTSFLDELNDLNRKRKLRLRYGSAAAIALIIIAGFGVHSVSSNPTSSKQEVKEVNSSATTDANQTNDQITAPVVATPPTPPTTPVSTQPKQSQPVSVQPPKPSGVDKASFIAIANQTLNNYSSIINTVNFGSSDTADTKASRIKQAVALDKQYFNQVTKLRGQLIAAGVSSGEYMDSVNLAESAVSKVSVGLTFMNYWASDQSRNSDLNSGSGTVTEGATLLLQFSDNLKKL